jgi:hypothetical protein
MGLRRDGAIVELIDGSWPLSIEGIDKSSVRAAVTKDLRAGS